MEKKINKKVGYLRISTKNQDLKVQEEQLKNIGIKEFTSEIISTSIKLENRKLFNLINEVEEETEIYVVALDRIARNTIEILNILEVCKIRNIKIITIRENLILEKNIKPENTMIISVLGSIAEMERKTIQNRVNKGLDNARKKGIKLGRRKGQKVKTKLDKYKKEILDYTDKGLTPKSIKKLLVDRIVVSEMTIYRFLKKIENEEKEK